MPQRCQHGRKQTRVHPEYAEFRPNAFSMLQSTARLNMHVREPCIGLCCSRKTPQGYHLHTRFFSGPLQEMIFFSADVLRLSSGSTNESLSILTHTPVYQIHHGRGG
jgi:hypothetical protein